MYTEENVRNFAGQIIGRIRHESNGDTTVFSFSGKILGHYIKQYDHTVNFVGQVVFRGDASASLITNPEYNPEINK